MHTETADHIARTLRAHPDHDLGNGTCPTFSWCTAGTTDYPCAGEYSSHWLYVADSLTDPDRHTHRQGTEYPVVSPSVRLDEVTPWRHGLPPSVGLHIYGGEPFTDTEVEMHPYEARVIAQRI